jgi:predicted transposase/invertase (TIGR01784 family)
MHHQRYTLDPKPDIVFWMLFGAERNRGLLIALLNAVLRPPSPISHVTVLHDEPERLATEDKAVALDLRVRLADGERLDIEMQSQRRLGLVQRVVYYWARLHAGQQARGADCVRLRRAVVILLANFRIAKRGVFIRLSRFTRLKTASV